jgi:hypothetical protein
MILNKNVYEENNLINGSIFLRQFRHYLAILGTTIWQYLALPGNTWQYLVIPGNTWKYLPVPGITCNTWQYLAIPGNTWEYLGIPVNTW